MKAGANFTDISRIRAYAAEGNTAEDISQAIQVELACVESYMPQDAKQEEEEKPKRKRRTKEEMAADAAEE